MNRKIYIQIIMYGQDGLSKMAMPVGRSKQLPSDINTTKSIMEQKFDEIEDLKDLNFQSKHMIFDPHVARFMQYGYPSSFNKATDDYIKKMIALIERYDDFKYDKPFRLKSKPGDPLYNEMREVYEKYRDLRRNSWLNLMYERSKLWDLVEGEKPDA